MLHLNLDLGEIKDLLDMKGTVEKAVAEAARDLAQMTKAKIQELARQKLKSRYKMYVEGLSVKELEDDIWVVNLDSSVRWIEDGQESFSMLEHLLKSPKAKTAKDGSKYLMVPFDHSPGKGSTSQGGEYGAAQQDLVATIRAEMKQINKARKKEGFEKISFAGIEKDDSGRPRLGKLHSFSIDKEPAKTHEGPGQGRGAIGEVRQGHTGIPFLRGINVYQTAYKGQGGETRVRRTFMTFRTASSKQRPPLWDHPGNEPLKLMEDGLEWARKVWETELSPEIVDKVISSL